MVNTRFSISVDPQVHEAVKVHAEAAGMDVSGYMVAAAAAQMAADDAAAAVFAPLDADNATALDEAVQPSGPPAFDELTPEEQKQVRRILSSALDSDSADVA
ncbi:hypothetical protein ACFHW2_12935 [Actinomadura sp. LOL_016]|uniref:hypothetical protein n=1 Tax=unclassified Actinomadura TaxID=2626254 RepID=UPI003A8071E3